MDLTLNASICFGLFFPAPAEWQSGRRLLPLCFVFFCIPFLFSLTAERERIARVFQVTVIALDIAGIATIGIRTIIVVTH
jgi:hypothetical protein